MKKEINYKPIEQKSGGKIHLTIYTPKHFFGNNKDFAVFVGGCGWGHRKTLKAAEKYLLKCAIEYCDRQINNAKEKIEEYSKHKDDLINKGIKNI